MQHEKKNRYAHKYVNILQRTVGDHVKVTYTSCQRGRWGEIFSSGVKKLFVYFSNCCWLLLSFIRDATDEKEKGGETKTAILFSWPVMALEKDLDEISFFFLSLSYTVLPMVGQRRDSVPRYWPYWGGTRYERPGWLCDWHRRSHAFCPMMDWLWAS